jgi:hypothetical protein
MMLLSPRLWAAIAIAIAFAAVGWKGYVMGKNTVQAEWDKVELKRQAEATKFSEQARAKELALNEANRRISDDLQKAKAARDAADKRVADGLRDFNSAISSTASKDTGSTCGADDTYRTIILECGNAITALDSYARGVAEKARGLQSYAELCVK